MNQTTQPVRFESVLAALLVGAPAAMWASDDGPPRSSIAAYFDMPNPAMYYMPLTAIAVMLFVNGTVRNGHQYNNYLGASMATLVMIDWQGPGEWVNYGATGVFGGTMVWAILGDSERLNPRARTALAALATGGSISVAGDLVPVFSAFWMEWAALAGLGLHYVADGSESIRYAGPRRKPAPADTPEE